MFCGERKRQPVNILWKREENFEKWKAWRRKWKVKREREPGGGRRRRKANKSSDIWRALNHQHYSLSLLLFCSLTPPPTPIVLVFVPCLPTPTPFVPATLPFCLCMPLPNLNLPPCQEEGEDEESGQRDGRWGWVMGWQWWERKRRGGGRKGRKEGMVVGGSCWPGGEAGQLGSAFSPLFCSIFCICWLELPRCLLVHVEMSGWLLFFLPWPIPPSHSHPPPPSTPTPWQAVVSDVSLLPAQENPLCVQRLKTTAAMAAAHTLSMTRERHGQQKEEKPAKPWRGIVPGVMAKTTGKKRLRGGMAAAHSTRTTSDNFIMYSVSCLLPWFVIPIWKRQKAFLLSFLLLNDIPLLPLMSLCYLYITSLKTCMVGLWDREGTCVCVFTHTAFVHVDSVLVWFGWFFYVRYGYVGWFVVWLVVTLFAVGWVRLLDSFLFS